MNNLTCLDAAYSTTRQITKQKPVIESQPEGKFESVLFLPEGEGRQGEGGLRTQGYFKTSLKEKPLITVITVVFNGEQYLEGTILSVINQTYDNVEYIIIDGGSTDGTLDIIRKYEHAIDYWVSEKDRGIYDAMNKGIDLATGEWLNFMNAGDNFYCSKTISEISFSFLREYMIYGNAVLSPSGNIQNQQDWDCQFNKQIIHQSIFFPALFIKSIKYDCSYKIMADFDLVKFFLHTRKKNVCFVNKIICFYDTSGISSMGVDNYYKEFLSIAFKNGYLEYFKAFIYIVPRVVFHKLNKILMEKV